MAFNQDMKVLSTGASLHLSRAPLELTSPPHVSQPLGYGTKDRQEDYKSEWIEQPIRTILPQPKSGGVAASSSGIPVPVFDADGIEDAKSLGDPAGVRRLKPGEELFAILKEMKLLTGRAGDSCLGRVVKDNQLGVIGTRGHIKFAGPGRYILWNPQSHWAVPNNLDITKNVVSAQGVTILRLSQSEIAVVKDSSGKTFALREGRYIITPPATFIEPVIDTLRLTPDQKPGVSNVAKHDRFLFFIIAPGEAAATTRKDGSICLLDSGQHVVADHNFDRFLSLRPTESTLSVAIPSRDNKVIDLVVQIEHQIVDPKKFIVGSGGNGFKDLFDAVNDRATSCLRESLSKHYYTTLREKMGEAEAQLEESLLNALQERAEQVGGHIRKVNITKFIATAEETLLAQHTAQQLSLQQEGVKQAQRFKNEQQKQEHELSQRSEKEAADAKFATQLQTKERAEQEHRLALQQAKAAADNKVAELNIEAAGARQRIEAQSQADAELTRLGAGRKARIAEIEEIAAAKATAERADAKARAEGIQVVAAALGSSPSMLELEKLRLEHAHLLAMSQQHAAMLQGLGAAGLTAVPVELNQMTKKVVDKWQERIAETVSAHVHEQAGEGAGALAAALSSVRKPKENSKPDSKEEIQ
jgi:regulator of protease activity HflC (stomatin/prohibitin superfamily)